VIRPTNEKEISKILLFATKRNISISIRGGGHSYTCQTTKHGGILLDMRNLKYISINKDNLTALVGAGVLWKELIPKLHKLNLIAVHGQCTSVGVAGFSLHGGVHFGGLSELYGLASGNILAITLVIANSSRVDISAKSCFIDGYLGDTQFCKDLWFALRGAGNKPFLFLFLFLPIFISISVM
jgi:FAD/FMN-containing dehydrogenase